METTKGKFCPKWGKVEAISGSKGIYQTICAESCARFSESLGTCIDNAMILSNISKNNSKYK